MDVQSGGSTDLTPRDGLYRLQDKLWVSRSHLEQCFWLTVGKLRRNPGTCLGFHW